MKKKRRWLGAVWNREVSGNFLAGLLFLLPVFLTFAIIGWLVKQIEAVLGPGTVIGNALTLGGVGLVGEQHQRAAFWLGIMLALCAIWLVGFLLKTRVVAFVGVRTTQLFESLPVVRTIYGPVSQVVAMMRQRDVDDLGTMSVVVCRLGSAHGASVLALQTSSTRYLFDGQYCVLVYLPSSPLPMSGGLMFVPQDNVIAIPELAVDDVMRIYFSLGALGASVMPQRFTGAPREA